MFGRRSSKTQTPGGAAPTPAPNAKPTFRHANAISALTPSDRLATLIYALNKAKAAGQKHGKPFDPNAALAALKDGRFQLRGTQREIDAQLLIIEAATRVLERAFAYDTDPSAQDGQSPKGPFHIDE